MQNVNDDDLEKCDVSGVHSALLSLVASMQVTEAVRLVTNKPPNMLSKLFFVYLENMELDSIEIKQSYTCTVCFPKANSKDHIKKSIIELCGNKTFLIPKKEHKNLHLNEIVENLVKKKIHIVKQGSMGLTFNLDTETHQILVSIFSNGNILIRGESEKDKVLEIYNKIVETLL